MNITLFSFGALADLMFCRLRSPLLHRSATVISKNTGRMICIDRQTKQIVNRISITKRKVCIETLRESPESVSTGVVRKKSSIGEPLPPVCMIC